MLLILILITVLPTDAVPSVILSRCAALTRIPGLFVGSGLPDISVTVMDPVSVDATAIAVCVNVTYELTDATDTVTIMEAPVS